MFPTKKRYLFFPFFFLCGALCIWVIFINWKFSGAIPDKVFYESKVKTWSHRGFSRGAPENSLESIEKAVFRGYPGVEIDVFYLPRKKNFIVSHNRPLDTLLSSKIFLEDVFKRFGSRIKIWIDFKNLEELSQTELQYCLEVLSQLNNKYNFKENTIFESKSASHLVSLKKAGYYTSYWVWLPRKSDIFYENLKLFQMKWNYLKGPFSAMSLHYDLFFEYQSSFEGKNVHVFTVNDINSLNRLAGISEIKIVLTDTLQILYP